MIDVVRIYWTSPWLWWLRALSLFFGIVWRRWENDRLDIRTAWAVAWTCDPSPWRRRRNQAAIRQVLREMAERYRWSDVPTVDEEIKWGTYE